MRSRVLAIMIAVVVPLVALGVVIVRGGGSVHKPARLPIAAGSRERATLGVAPVGAVPALYPYGGIVYKAGPNLPPLTGQARAYKVTSADEAAVRRLADAFGLQDRVDYPGQPAFTFTNGDEQLTVEPTGGSWRYSRSTAGGGSVSSGVAVACPANTDCPVPETTVPQHPADLPSHDGAKAAALGVLQRAGIDTNHAVVTVDDAITQWIIRVDPMIDGMTTEGFGSSVTVGEHGVVEYASGSLGAPVAADEYPLVGSGVAIERLSKGEGFVGPQPMWARDTNVANTSGDATTITGAAPAPAPDAPITDTLPPPLPQEISLTGVERVLLFAFSHDGSENWLVPGYRFSTADGVGPSVLAIDDSFLTPAPASEQPVPATEKGR